MKDLKLREVEAASCRISHSKPPSWKNNVPFYEATCNTDYPNIHIDPNKDPTGDEEAMMYIPDTQDKSSPSCHAQHTSFVRTEEENEEEERRFRELQRQQAMRDQAPAHSSPSFAGTFPQDSGIGSSTAQGPAATIGLDVGAVSPPSTIFHESSRAHPIDDPDCDSLNYSEPHKTTADEDQPP